MVVDVNVTENKSFYIGGYQPLHNSDGQDFMWQDGSIYHDSPFLKGFGFPVIDSARRCLAMSWRDVQMLSTTNELCNNTDYHSICEKNSCKFLV